MSVLLTIYILLVIRYEEKTKYDSLSINHNIAFSLLHRWSIVSSEKGSEVAQCKCQFLECCLLVHDFLAFQILSDSLVSWWTKKLVFFVLKFLLLYLRMVVSILQWHALPSNYVYLWTLRWIFIFYVSLL